MKNETFPLLLLIATIVNLGISQSTKAQSIHGENVDFSEGNSELGSKVAGELSVSFDKDKKLTGMNDRFVAPVAKNPPQLSKRKQITESLQPESSTKTAFYVNSGFTSFDTSLEGLLESRSTRVTAQKTNQNLLRKAINQSQSIARINHNTRKASFSQGEDQSFLTPLHPFFKQKDAIASTPPPNEFPQTQDLSDRKNDLKINPLDPSFVNAPRTYSSSLTFTFSAFGANWGDLFVGGSLATAGKKRFVAPVAKNPPQLSKRKQITESLQPESSTKTAFYVNSGFTSFDTSLEGLLESRSTRVTAQKTNQNLLRKAINQSQSIARINHNTRKASFSQGEDQSFLTPLHPFFKQKDAIASTPPPNEFPQTQDLSDRKKDLKINPLDPSFVNALRTYSSSLTFTFSAFGANWGDLFVGGSLATAGKKRFVAPVAKNPPQLSKRKQITESLQPESSTKTAFYVNSGFTSFDTSLEGLLESRSARVTAQKTNQNLLRKAINQSQSIARINHNTRKSSFSQGEDQSFLTPLHPFFKQKDAIASTPPPNEFPPTQDLSDRKKDLKINPLDPSFVNAPRTYSPSLTFTFSAFGANWGDLFIGGSAATPGRQRNRIDGYLGLGFGLGDASNLIGSTVSFNMQSIRNFGATNGIDVDFHRIVFNDTQTQVAMAVGVTNLIKIYSGNYPDRLAEGYWGAITSYTFLRPDDPVNSLPLALTVGGASGQFQQTDVGIFGGVGIQLAPQLGVGAAWSGVSLDLGMSYVPIPTFPLTLTMEGIDLTNNTPGGPRFLLGINVGYNFSPRGY